MFLGLKPTVVEVVHFSSFILIGLAPVLAPMGTKPGLHAFICAYNVSILLFLRGEGDINAFNRRQHSSR